MRVTVLGTREAPSTLRQILWPQQQRGHAPEVINRVERPYWMERGWIRNGNNYVGNYQTRYGSYSGYIEQQGSNSFQFFILDPPKEMEEHSHWTCFQYRGDQWWHIHMGRKPADISAGILAIERLLTEAFES